MASAIPNRYIHRKVADGAGKACDICYKITTSVLITEGKEDFFYICPIHLKDTNFCNPDPDEVKGIRDRETQLVVDEWKAKQKTKEEAKTKEEDKSKEEDKTKEDDKAKEAAKDDAKDDKDTKDKEDKTESKPDDSKTIEKPNDPNTTEKLTFGSEPRIFNLKLPFFKRRTAKKRQAEETRRARSMMSQPNLFPSVPKDSPR